MGRILVGTSGWSYRDWVGRVYPPTLSCSRFFDHVARFLPAFEINSTFYRDPPRRTVESWVAQARRYSTELSVKVPRAISEDLLREGSFSKIEERVSLWKDLVLTPLQKGGVLGGVLLQLPPSFAPTPGALLRLSGALHALEGHSVAVEFRNPLWVEGESPKLRRDARETLDLYGATLVGVDGPPFPFLSDPSSPDAYLRLHGRNFESWRSPQESPSLLRYHYRYSPKELEEISEKVGENLQKRNVRVFFNNHPEGHAFHNARSLLGILKERGLPVVLPRPFSTPQTLLDDFGTKGL